MSTFHTCLTSVQRAPRTLQRAAPDADSEGNELRPSLLPALPHRARRLRPSPQGPVAARRPRRRRDAPGRRPRAADARGHRARGPTEMLGEPDKLQEFREDGEVDFAYSIPGLARFRCNAFRQRGSVSLVIRAIPVSIKTIDELSLPAGHPRAGRGGARDRAAHRHHRLGQVDDAGRDDRPHQLDPPAPHRDRRGPARVPPRGQEVDHQPARGRDGHRLVQARAAPRPAPGPRRHPHRRDARRGDGPHRAERGGDRPPRLLDGPHRRRRRDGQPPDRLLPAAHAQPGARDDRLDAQGRRLPAPRPDRSTAAAASPAARSCG